MLDTEEWVGTSDSKEKKDCITRREVGWSGAG